MTGTSERVAISRELLHRGRAICPACGAKGVGFANHPHALGYKDYGRARCRYCRKTFKLVHPWEDKR